jgi:bifunctional DNA-binding transcriptional regulator/antitoxin component of YhaV-PrlF toxin-antitoxin module
MQYYESKEVMEVATMEMAKATAKGQITIPVKIRRKLESNVGSRMFFIENWVRNEWGDC